MSSWVRVGAKCVCVDDDWRTYYTSAYAFNPFLIKKGTVYVVRSVGTDPISGFVTIKLEGVSDRSADDFGYNVERFRPIITKTQSEDIEMFLRIASKAPSNMEMTE